IGIEGGTDPDNRRDFPGGFPNDPRSAFTDEGRTKQEREIFNSVRRLLWIRRAQLSLRGGEMLFLHDKDGLIAYLRMREAERTIVAINNTDSAAELRVKLPTGLFAENARLVDQLGRSPTLRVKHDKLILRLAAQKAAIYKQNN